eukprot:scaffold66287_cov36-Phaeocystis_antarctica.AAC.1
MVYAWYLHGLCAGPSQVERRGTCLAAGDRAVEGRARCTDPNPNPGPGSNPDPGPDPDPNPNQVELAAQAPPPSAVELRAQRATLQA